MKKSELRKIIKKIIIEQVGPNTAPVGQTMASGGPAGGTPQITTVTQAIQAAIQYQAPPDVVNSLRRMQRYEKSGNTRGYSSEAKRLLGSMGTPDRSRLTEKKEFWDTWFGRLLKAILWAFLAGAAAAYGGSIEWE